MLEGCVSLIVSNLLRPFDCPNPISWNENISVGTGFQFSVAVQGWRPRPRPRSSRAMMLLDAGVAVEAPTPKPLAAGRAPTVQEVPIRTVKFTSSLCRRSGAADNRQTVHRSRDRVLVLMQPRHQSLRDQAQCIKQPTTTSAPADTKNPPIRRGFGNHHIFNVRATDEPTPCNCPSIAPRSSHRQPALVGLSQSIAVEAGTAHALWPNQFSGGPGPWAMLQAPSPTNSGCIPETTNPSRRRFIACSVFGSSRAIMNTGMVHIHQL